MRLFSMVLVLVSVTFPASFAPAQVEEPLAAIGKLLADAERGDVNAQVQLANEYMKKDGLFKPDPVQAAQWYRKAAEQGHPQAQLMLGMMLKEGVGVAQNRSEAAEWLRKAAEQGHPMAQLELGRAYQSGTGVKQDAVEAYKWLHIAATRARGAHQEPAERARGDIAKKMTREQILAAEQQAAEWEPKGAQMALQQGKRTAPVAVLQPMPPYTDAARSAKVEGVVMVQCVIRKDGTVAEAAVRKGLGYGLDESAIETITTKWRFRPGTLDGEAVDVPANVEVLFRLNARR